MKLLYDFLEMLRAVRADLKEYFLKDPSARSETHVAFTSIGFHALLFYRISHFFWCHRMKWLAEFIHYAARILFSVDIHPAAKIEPGVVIDHGIGTVIGSTTSIGSGTLIYHGVTLGTRKLVEGKRHPDVGRNVVIGAGAKILGPLVIGDNAKIGANSVVLEHVQPNTTVVGIPARPVSKFCKCEVQEDEIA
ncbi:MULTISPECIES: serine O-acetyltransferase [Kosmotoga]|uniref:Serine acetyltransferase n=1 Tax=Kosmotoga olearia (strain ATCC BAA-1733 / DSM 21960 / TBF 19.5.1) TaxID=521045 RepID=C5CDM7_KOSOT|nr:MULTISPECIES: serine O-acetyltransferase [Kosmotoga]ACR80039.1 serine O-acetyltransferase [Kosmotoga olearia TBF 19.5.1]MDI3524559.1 serine O-acetyltransferase [Kosmotoga sp.]MDK2954350.1 serine O-acetyltransferase [Kosmotoga sp.]OAA20479.1 serine acetyltransferase [Kosmotoga sp. DU53]